MAFVWFTFGPGRSVNQLASGSGPHLQFEETSYDFGQVPLNQYVEHDFVYRNVGDQPLVLQKTPKVDLIQGC